MKVLTTWKRNKTDTLTGESITVSITYSSFDKNEIDELQKQMPKGILVTDTEKTRNDIASGKVHHDCKM